MAMRHQHSNPTEQVWLCPIFTPPSSRLISVHTYLFSLSCYYWTVCSFSLYCCIFCAAAVRSILQCLINKVSIYCYPFKVKLLWWTQLATCVIFSDSPKGKGPLSTFTYLLLCVHQCLWTLWCHHDISWDPPCSLSGHYQVHTYKITHNLPGKPKNKQNNGSTHEMKAWTQKRYE